jgi:hypothetical protein
MLGAWVGWWGCHITSSGARRAQHRRYPVAVKGDVDIHRVVVGPTAVIEVRV